MPTAIDLFAGLGGWSTGARAGSTAIAINEWPIEDAISRPVEAAH